MSETVVTTPFVTTSGEYLSILIGIWLPRHGWKVVLPLAVCALAGVIYDVRFMLVALMLLFIAVPMGISFLYTYYMLTPEVRKAVLKKQAEISPGHFIRLTYILPDEKAENISEMDEDTDSNHAISIPSPEMIEWKDIVKVKHTSRYYVYMLSTDRIQFILIPYDSVPSGSVLC